MEKQKSRRRWLKIIFRIFIGIVALLGLAYLTLYILLKPDEKGRVVFPWESVDISVLPEFQSALSDRKTFEIFEGLPHQNWESKLLKSEIKSKETMKTNGFHFYSEALVPAKDDEKRLVEALNADGGIVEWGGMKMCGGFHPDYLIKWSNSTGDEFVAHVCFGCHEIKLYGADFKLYADLGKETYDMLVSILSELGVNRPKQNDEK